MIAIGSSLNKIIKVIEEICNAHAFAPSFGYGPTSDINADNQTIFPLVWVEPTESRVINSDQGAKVAQLSLNLYALDRIDKGDSNFLDIHSDMMYLLQTIVGFIRESSFTRDQYITIDRQDQVFTPVTRETDENCNGFMLRLVLRMPDVYTPCNSPFSGITYSFPQYLPQALYGQQGPQGFQGPTGPQGFQGVQGPFGPVGPAGLNWQGMWTASATYSIDDAVGYNGASWFYFDPTPSSGNVPFYGSPYWALLADQGFPGPQGVQGATGPQGSQPGGITFSFQINDGNNQFGSFGLLTNDSILFNNVYTQTPATASNLRNYFIGNPNTNSSLISDDTIAIGSFVLATASASSNSVLIGNYSGGSLITMNGSVFIGFLAGGGSTSSTNNVFIGANAGSSNSGRFNTFVGFGAGRFNTGINNTFIGSNSNITGSGNTNTLIGNNTGGTGSNSIVIGSGAQSTTNNQLVIGSLGTPVGPIQTGTFSFGSLGVATGVTFLRALINGVNYKVAISI